VTLALYRAYRPGTLADVVGQDHVTDPLTRALQTGRIHHAYLFSGPRGCGKTSTARILARSLNCEQGPTPEPCGECDSCLALAPNGPGSEDVVELDAASHGGVDDTRELRERVIYSPARSRYRIYIIDEAHMVTTQGFNALLKVIEEPPPYVRFIFATTEPEKVLGTIRSRTFHYSFRLVSTSVLSGHLASVCAAEGVPFDEAALPLIAKASGGSVRDSLSLLGQLIAGSDDAGLTQDLVAHGLGLTDAVLLDRVITAIAARDGAAAFAAVDAVVESGHDGRRFLTDLLERLRDLIVLQHVPASAHGALLQLPAEQIEALHRQGELFGPSELSRAADLVSAGLSELKGATAPRLQLELLLARLLLPTADDGTEGLAARLDRLERRVAAGVVHAPTAPAAEAKPNLEQPRADQQAEPSQQAPSTPDQPAAAAGKRPAPERDRRPRKRGGPGPTPPPRLSDLAPATASGSQSEGPAAAEASRGATPAAAPPPAQPDAGPATEAAPPAPPPPDEGIGSVREGWPAVLAELGKRSRVAWTLWESSRPQGLANRELTVAVADQGRLTSITSSRRDELLRQVLIDVLRLDVRVKPVLAAQAAEPDATDGDASADDPDLGSSDVSGVDLVVRELGAVRIGEIGEA
jgi:DNA polymerase-3 subunit gamma/tau